jgi:hypothetical protein
MKTFSNPIERIIATGALAGASIGFLSTQSCTKQQPAGAVEAVATTPGQASSSVPTGSSDRIFRSPDGLHTLTLTQPELNAFLDTTCGIEGARHPKAIYLRDSKGVLITHNCTNQEPDKQALQSFIEKGSVAHMGLSDQISVRYR